MMTQSVGVPRTAKRRSLDLPQAERIGERQRMRDAGIVHLRRHHPDVVGELSRDPLRDVEAGRVDAVVVGDEDFHAARSTPRDGATLLPERLASPDGAKQPDRGTHAP